jgi:hypothetical protein
MMKVTGAEFLRNEYAFRWLKNFSLLLNAKVCYRLYKSLPVICILSHMIPVITYISFLKSVFDITLLSVLRSPNLSLPFMFWTEILNALHIAPVCCMSHPSHLLL